MMNKWLSNPNVVKVIALILGILLWVVVSTDQNTTTGSSITTIKENTISNVKITPLYDEDVFAIQSLDPSEVVITVSGRDSALKKVNVGTYRIVLDLTNGKAGENTVPLKAEYFPSGVEVSVYPPYVRVVLEAKQQKEMPVDVEIQGTPMSGYMAGQPVVKPARVLVTGASSIINDVASVRASVNVDQVTEAVMRQVKLVAYDADGKIIEVSMNPQVVDVDIPITQPFKMMPLQIKSTGAPISGYSVASFVSSTEQVTVYGSQELLNAMEFYEGPLVDLTGLSESKTFTLDIPLRSKVTKLEPGKIDVKVEIVPTTSRNFAEVPLTIVGQNAMYNTNVTNPSNARVSLTLEGAQAVLDKLKLQDVQAIVDVSNIPPGVHEVPVTINVGPFVRRSGAELKATVEIIAKATPTPVPTPSPTPSPTSVVSPVPSSSPSVTPSPGQGGAAVEVGAGSGVNGPSNTPGSAGAAGSTPPTGGSGSGTTGNGTSGGAGGTGNPSGTGAGTTVPGGNTSGTGSGSAGGSTDGSGPVSPTPGSSVGIGGVFVPSAISRTIHIWPPTE